MSVENQNLIIRETRPLGSIAELPTWLEKGGMGKEEDECMGLWDGEGRFVEIPASTADDSCK